VPQRRFSTSRLSNAKNEYCREVEFESREEEQAGHATQDLLDVSMRGKSSVNRKVSFARQIAVLQ
jgi:hypothetical protein